MNFFYLALIGGIAIFFLIVVLLVLHGKNRRYLNALLCLGIIGIMWYAVIYLLTSTGNIKYFPDLFNKGLPFYYLIGPCFYLYMRGSIYPAYASFHKRDLLHLLVAIPAICSIWPYCMLDDASQKRVVALVAENQNYVFSDSKYIVGVWHWFAWPFTALVYTILQFFLIKRSAGGMSFEKRNIGWMYSVTVLCGVVFAVLLVLNTVVLLDKRSASEILGSSNLVLFLCWCLLGLAGLFFSNPRIIYGSRFDDVENNTHLKVLEIPIANQTELNQVSTHDLTIISNLENFLETSRIYLETGLTLSKFSVAAGIPSYKLSDLLNHHYKKNFNAYINHWRIKYIVQRLGVGDHKTLTLEALANEAGFTSRNSFFTAFKKEMGLSPSAYVASLKMIPA